MAEQETKTYPMLPTNAWWKIRNRLVTAIPSQFTETYLASVLEIQPKSVANNVLPYLRQTGLIDENGVPSGLVTRWREDEHYAAVCDEIRRKLYPQELLDLFPDTNTDRASVVSWFRQQAGVGNNAATKMASFYLLLADGDVSKDVTKKGTDKLPRKPVSRKKHSRASRVDYKKDDEHGDGLGVPPGKSLSVPAMSIAEPTLPALCLNLQIHISSDATAEQIEMVFKSMAKHLYGRG